ncbi:oligosaccharide repeat unit polymerase [Bacillus aerolatus]|uniref:Oligosaccharide repeat unit polymerase n=1 Tax=Bacillus aerolatus TaxID=2653354 RepID=A0A6I1FGN6_9BACI|nr:O-antigen polymerase [Bacillus aerolatus]KAB7707382.1 oligosaccharide repeat unit polymerase [Bacillus aerolatus]
MIYLLCIFLIIFILLIARYIGFKFNKHYIISSFIILFVLVFYIIPLLKYNIYEEEYITLVSSTFSVAHSSEINKYSLYSLTFILFVIFSYIISYMLLAKSKIIKCENYIELTKKQTLFNQLSFLSLCGSVGLIYFSGMNLSNLLASSRFAFFETQNTVFSLLSTYLTYLLVVPTYLIASKKASINWLYILSLAATFFILMFVFGTRSQIIAIAFSYLMGRMKVNPKINPKYLILSAVFVHLFVIWQFIRYNMKSVDGVSGFIDLILFNNKEAYLLSLESGDLSWFYDATFTAMYIKDYMNFSLDGDTYLRLLLTLFPSTIFDFKPEETQRIFAAIINPEAYIVGATFPPSILGDAYLNFGFNGVVIGLFLGCFLAYAQFKVNYFDNILSIVLGSTIFIFLLLLTRGTFNGLYPLIFCALVLYLLNFLSLISKKEFSYDKKVS